ncbi:MAG: TonB-dependent receptor [Pseudomonadales bacterium]|nr:TonB-dependent receptor [Pseudomonadales bacterium]MBO7006999.1 TonB-dependent receptor [Pseudomonadales bacterium]
MKKTSFALALVGFSIAMMHTVPAFAEDETAIEEVVVTGTRVKSNANSAQPVSSFDSEDFARGGQLDIAEILNNSPALLSSVTSANSLDSEAANIAGTNNLGGSALNLRGLGIARTLTLVNGRRHVAGIEGTAAVDVSTIPSALIERVDILSGGASAIYGADAVTGVVNFILKDDYEGFEISGQTGQATEDSYGTSQISMIAGLNFDEGRGNVVFSAQYDKVDGLLWGDRDFLANNGLYDDDQNPALRFQQGEIDAASTPNLAAYYDFATTGEFGWGLRIPSSADFISNYEAQFGSTPNLTAAEMALFDRAATAPPRAILPGRTFNITSPYGVIVAGDFGVETPLGSEPDVDGNGTPDCLQSFTGYNSSLGGASSFGIAGGCWVLNAAGEVVPYQDGLVAGSFNHFGAENSYIRPNRIHAVPEEEKYSVNFNGHYDINDSVTAFWETKYVHIETEIFEQYHNFTDLLYGAPDNPWLPAELAALANNGGLGFAGLDGGLNISRDAADWGDNLTTNERDLFRFVVGLEGETKWFSYEVSANVGRFERKMVDREEVIMDRFFAAIDAVTDPATGEVVCRSDLDPTAYPRTTPFDIPQYVGGGVPSSFFTFQPGDGQCQPMNIWAGDRGMSQESIDFVTFDRIVEEEINQFVFSGFISGDSSEWFELPGGPLAYVVGIEYREEETRQDFGDFDQGNLPVGGVTYDGQVFSAGDWVGDVSAAKSLGPTPATRLLSSSSDYDFFDYYVEFQAPVLSGVTMAEELSFEAAYRESDNSEFGKHDTYKLGAVWAPISDVQFRYTFSESTRVPNLFELFSPEQGARFRPADPCDVINIGTAANPALRQQNCIADLQANGVLASNIYDGAGNYAFEDPLSAGFPGAVGGNPGLLPETADTESFGFVLTPSFVPGLAVSVDYINIDIEDAIVSVSAQNIVNGCYDGTSLDNAFCGLISRNDDPASAQSGGLDFVRQVQLNFGSAEYEGIDYAINYGFAVSDFIITAQLNYTDVQTLEFIQNDVVDDELGEMRRPEQSGTIAITVDRGPLSVTWSTAYLGEQTLGYEDGVEIETAFANYGDAAFTDSSTFIHDVRVSYLWNEAFSFFGGMTNVTDEEPFVTERAYPASPVGRYAFLGVNYRMQ